jgi:archaemetzincin
MNDKQRVPRRRFDSASFAPVEAEVAELPLEPLPPEPRPGEILRPSEDAPMVVVPIGALEEKILKNLVNPISQTFGRSVILHKQLPVPKYAFNPSRGQYHASAILKRVETLRLTDWDCAIGVVDVDLFVPDVPFVFSEADRSTRSAVISVARLRPEIGSADSRIESLAKRLLSEIVHQMGLIRGLAHCPNNRCVMFMSTTVQDTDKKGVQFCANCRKRLATENVNA